MELKNKRAIVTGAAQGLGEHIAAALLKEGAKVVFADVNAKKLKSTTTKYGKNFPRKIFSVETDVTDEASVRKMVELTVKKLKGIDILVSNAGILISGDTTEFKLEDWKRVIDVNLVGYFLCAKYVAKQMMKQRSGVIIQINSKSGKIGSYKNTAYAASKFGGIGLTQSLALELAPYGIRVNAICPGNLLDSPLWVNSLYAQYAKKWGISKKEVRRRYEEQVPMGRGCSYDDVANMVIFLASNRASYITGQSINVTGGQVM